MDSQATFRAFYGEHFRFVWRSLRRLGLSESDAPDACQDVFVVAFRKLGEFEGRSKVTTWLFGICFRVAKDRRRLRELRRRREEVDADDAIRDDKVDVDFAVARNQAARAIEEILDSMPLEQRAVFTLFELENVGGEEISEMLEIPVGTVWSRLRLAREVFRRAAERMAAQERSHVLVAVAEPAS